ncbi:hypothetical protein PMIN06_001908 [Paraphaeosphaeria minitans]|uniref:Uncharacterized protein n=1 Tax=Paraphaeosphaeria minitans TaxID=565426 RepID=A0A9P6GKP5_9PLEO|nr:hypothetical protein PMIN01_04927 [Paraphaeosphaeria minitans]
MQFTMATISALFAATACALPAAQGSSAPATATVSFINDQTGAHAPVVAPLDGTVINLYNVLTGTPVGVPNQVIASSAQLINYPQNVDCTINGIDGNQLGQLTARQTYVLLQSGGLSLDGATMTCTPLLL